MKNPVVISFGGGKGGIGKSTIVSNIGALLASKNLRVGFIDADLGGANLHLCLGVKRPGKTLQDFITCRSKNLSDIAEQTIVPNTWLISGASDILELANPQFCHKQKIITHLKQLTADYILIDLAAGTSTQVTDFFIAFNNGVVICDGLPTSIENAYGFLKNSLIRAFARLFPGRKDLAVYFKQFSDPNLQGGYATVGEMLAGMGTSYPGEARRIKEWLAQRKTFLILNMVTQPGDIEKGKNFAAVVKKYLQVSLHYLGYIIEEPQIRRSLRNLRPLVIDNPPVKTLECFTTIAENLHTFARA